jgi:hypothetical protein
MDEQENSVASAASIPQNDPDEETESESEDKESFGDIEENEELHEFPDAGELDKIEEKEVKGTPDPGEELSFPWMPDEYRWKDWLNKKLFPELSKSYKHDGKPKKLGPEMISMGTKITPEDMRNRCIYRGWKPDERDNLAKCNAEISAYKAQFSDTIDIILSNFMMDIARKLDFGNDKNGNGLKDWNALLLAVEAAEKKEDCKKIVIFLYIIFDWIPFYQLQIARFVCKIHNVKIHNRDKTKEYVKGSTDFMQKMVSLGANILRKQVNDTASERKGFKYTIVRYGPYLAERKSTNDNRKKKHFYHWMVRFNAVSYFLIWS